MPAHENSDNRGNQPLLTALDAQADGENRKRLKPILKGELK